MPFLDGHPQGDIMNRCESSEWPLIGLISIAVLFLFSILTSPVHAELKGIATLENFMGDIIVKNNGKWGTAHLKGLVLYNGDKVVATKGTAHVVFHDGSELNIEPNSNVRIIEGVVKRGFIFKKMVKERRIRVLIGKTKYKEEFSKKRQTRFEAPTAVAALRGTEISFGVDDTGTAYGRIIDGNWYTLGEVISGEAPDLPSEIAGNTPAQRFALVATQAAIQTAAAASKVSEAAEAVARASATAGDKLNKVRQEVKAAAVVIVQTLAAAEEGKLEAEMMARNADPRVVEEALEAIRGSDSAMTAMDAAKTAADHAMEATTRIVEVAEKAIKEEDAAGLNAALEAAKAQAGAAVAHAGVAQGYQAVLDAQTAGATGVSKEMEAKVAKSTQLAARSTEVAASAGSDAERAIQAGGAEAEAFAQAAKASASAASTLSGTVQANTAGVLATVGGDPEKAHEAFQASDKAAQAANMALGFAEKATAAAETGDLVEAALAAESAEFFETKTEETIEGVIDVLGIMPTPDKDGPQQQDWKIDAARHSASAGGLVLRNRHLWMNTTSHLKNADHVQGQGASR
jgi:hypothetical protein